MGVLACRYIPGVQVIGIIVDRAIWPCTSPTSHQSQRNGLGLFGIFNSEGSNRPSKKITSRRQGSGSRGSNGFEAYMHRHASLITFNSIAALEPGDCLPFCNVKELGTASSPGVYKGASL